MQVLQIERGQFLTSKSVIWYLKEDKVFALFESSVKEFHIFGRIGEKVSVPLFTFVKHLLHLTNIFNRFSSFVNGLIYSVNFSQIFYCVLKVDERNCQLDLLFGRPSALYIFTTILAFGLSAGTPSGRSKLLYGKEIQLFWCGKLFTAVQL